MRDATIQAIALQDDGHHKELRRSHRFLPSYPVEPDFPASCARPLAEFKVDFTAPRLQQPSPPLLDTSDCPPP